MFKLFKDSFKTATDCIILAIPFVLFMCILSFYFAFSNSVVDTPAKLGLAFFTVLFMVGAFLSGWFYMVKNAIQISKVVYVMDEDRAKATMNLFKDIPYGIGKYFISFILMALAFILIVSITAYLVLAIGNEFIGNVFTSEQITMALSSTQDMKAFIDSLDITQKEKLFLWNLLIMCTTTFMSYLLMLWIPEIIYKTMNPLIALFKSIGKLFIKFPKTLLLFVYISILNIIMSFLSTFTLVHPLLYILIMVIYFYFIVYVVVLVFSFYEKEFCEGESNEDQKA